MVKKGEWGREKSLRERGWTVSGMTMERKAVLH